MKPEVLARTPLSISQMKGISATSPSQASGAASLRRCTDGALVRAPGTGERTERTAQQKDWPPLRSRPGSGVGSQRTRPHGSLKRKQVLEPEVTSRGACESRRSRADTGPARCCCNSKSSSSIRQLQVEDNVGYDNTLLATPRRKA